jgi:hypothetical protein
MLDFSLYHASSIAHLPISNWDDLATIRSHHYNIRKTGDGHLLHFHEPGKTFVEELGALRGVALEPERGWTGFSFHFYYGDRL